MSDPTSFSHPELHLEPGFTLYSLGDWEREEDSVKHLKLILEKHKLFRVYSEIDGMLIQPRLFCEEKGMRIDMILSPLGEIRKAGWEWGPIGIECKRSGEKINDAFAQVQDYQRAVWKIPDGFRFMCQYYFIWPFPKAHGFMASQMAQNSIGTLEHRYDKHNNKLRFFLGETKAMVCDLVNKTIEVNKNLENIGKKSGSR